jgi:RimJ/RimL family protein N-acetyltransferase
LSAQHKTPLVPPASWKTSENSAAQMTALTKASPRDGLVTIGPVCPEDTGALFLWLNDFSAANLDSTYRPVDWLTFKAWLDNLGGGGNQVLFAIRKLHDPQIIGFVLFRNFQMVHRSAELGIRIGVETERGRGYGRAAIRLALRYAWDQLNLHRVSLKAYAHNCQAVAAYLSAGFKEEGILQQSEFIGGQWVDQVSMAALNPRECDSGFTK